MVDPHRGVPLNIMKNYSTVVQSNPMEGQIPLKMFESEAGMAVSNQKNSSGVGMKANHYHT